ncbi:MAG: efflux RND transporter periplasmic adaptor subunit [Anaerolineae bacterium]|jgi:multidrug efflux pump subunit AcrA (membrane-fusion protein)
MKRERILPIVIVAVVVVIVLAAVVYFAANPASWRQVLVELELAQPAIGGVSASGFIEGEEIDVASEVGGRIVGLQVEEGDSVESGQVLVRLNDAQARAQAEVAQAGLEVAEARLAQARAGARPERIRQAEAALAQAEAVRDGAYQAWQDALAIVANPQQLEVQIAQVEARVAQAEAGLERAVALKDAADIAFRNFEEAREEVEELKEIPLPYRPPVPSMPLDFHLIPNAYWRAWIGVNTAGAAYEGAQEALGLLYEMRENPHQLEAAADAAEARYRAAESAVEAARAGLEGLQAGATEEEIDALEAQVQQAQAELDSAHVMLEKLILTSPVSGRVLEVAARAGELAVPGATLITLADLDQVMLTIYVPQDRLGQVQVGQRVEVRVDSFPDRVFVGRVASIASEAEFTPRNVQTEEERVNMVFAVEVVIPNPDHDLKPGMPADAVIVTQEQ